jgi:fluoroquinolone resistance protein
LSNQDRETFEERNFEKCAFAEITTAKADFENCSFRGCSFSETDLSNNNFVDCLFDQCNLCSAVLKNTSLRNCLFKNCKILGVNFEACNGLLFSVSFENCILNLSVFGKIKMRGTSFKDTSLQEVDFRQTDLFNSNFANCDLTRTLFAKTNLERVDFRTAYNYSFSPDGNSLKKAKFSLPAVVGLLNHLDIEIE